MLRKSRILWRNEDGTALIESAVLLPMLFVLIFGVFEFSWIFREKHLITTGLRDAARYIAQSGNPNDPLVKQGARLLATTGEVDGGTPRVRGWSADQVEVSYTLLSNPVDNSGVNGLRGGPVIQSVTVSTTLTIPTLGFFAILGLTSPVVTMSDEERVIGSR